MLIDGLIIMAIGMGVVFAFLVIMVISMNATSFLLAKLPEEEVKPKKLEKVHDKNDEIAIAIAAVRAFG